MNKNCLAPALLAQSITGLTDSRSLPLLSKTTSNASPPTTLPTSAGFPHTVLPPALTISENLLKGGFFILSELSSPTVRMVTECPAPSSPFAK
uniref:Uncharacterized protein n=1 Tax=Medicago truncatula TaxID=3880 RepID=I3S964_MEDTR|nr:unknown [Medicago truncatula]